MKVKRVAFFGVLFLLAVLLVVPVSAFERGGQRQGASPGEIVARLSEKVQLSAEQQEAVLPIIEQSVEQKRKIRQDLRNQGVRDRSAGNSLIQEQQSIVEAQLAEILTEQQMAGYRQLLEEQSASRKGRRF